MQRREYLAAAGAGLATTFAGCTGGGGGGDGGGDGDDGGDGGSTPTEGLPPKSDFEAYEEAWLERAVEGAQEEGGEFVLYGFSDDEDIRLINEFFSNTDPYTVLDPTIPSGNNDEQIQQYMQAAQAERAVVDVVATSNITLIQEEGIALGQMDDIPAYIEIPDNIKVNSAELGDIGPYQVLNRGINYNTDVIPKSKADSISGWGDLVGDEWTDVPAIMDFTFNTAVAAYWMDQTYETPDGEELTPEELAPRIVDNLDFEFVASATSGAAMVARAETGMQLMGTAQFIVGHVNDGLPLDHVRSPETIIPYVNPVSLSAFPTNEWSAKLATHAFIKEPGIQVFEWGQMTPNREVGGEHPTLGSTLDLYAGSELVAPFVLENPGAELRAFQEAWGAPV